MVPQVPNPDKPPGVCMRLPADRMAIQPPEPPFGSRMDQLFGETMEGLCASSFVAERAEGCGYANAVREDGMNGNDRHDTQDKTTYKHISTFSVQPRMNHLL